MRRGSLIRREGKEVGVNGGRGTVSCACLLAQKPLSGRRRVEDALACRLAQLPELQQVIKGISHHP